MAKKRRLSKWEKKVAERANEHKTWNELMENEEFLHKIFQAIEIIKRPFSGAFGVRKKTLYYCVLDDEDNLIEYEVAVLTNNGVFVYNTPYSDDEAPF